MFKIFVFPPGQGQQKCVRLAVSSVVLLLICNDTNKSYQASVLSFETRDKLSERSEEFYEDGPELQGEGMLLHNKNLKHSACITW